jgi:hypothetical protein
MSVYGNEDERKIMPCLMIFENSENERELLSQQRAKCGRN